MKKIITVIAVLALMAILGTVLFACVPKTLEKAEAKMKKAGYEVEITKVSDYEKDEEMEEYAEAMKKAGIVGYLDAHKGETEWLDAVLYESASKAKDAFDDAKKEYEAFKDEDIVVKRSGKWIYAGTKAAVKAFK